MKTLNGKIIIKLVCMIVGLMLTFGNTWAESDMQLQEKALKARELMNRKADVDHSAHQAIIEELGIYRGVFYGYLPCKEKDCDGFKMTLSLKQKNNYLMVTQNAMASAREYYDKGKFDWDESKHSVLLTSNKDGSKHYLTIKDEGTLVLLNSDGKPNAGDQDRFILRRSDKANTRDVHIH